MRVVAGQFRELTQADLAFARQIGCSSVTVNKPDLDSPAWIDFLNKQFTAAAGPRPPTRRWSALDLVQMRAAVEAHGLALDCIEGVPRNLLDKAMLGLPGAEEQVEDFKATLRAMGQAGIPVLGYNWIPDGVWRTAKAAHGRGGALVTAYDDALGQRVATGTLPPRSEAQMWANWERFITAVLPVAQDAGVKLSLHPDDPPVPVLDGVARIFRDEASFARAMAFADSPMHGIAFCTGTFAESGAAAMMAALRRFARAGRIHYVHLRSVAGALPRFAEAFIDEGSVDPVAVLRELLEAGFDGFVIDDHVPHVVEDTVWGHRSRAYATGYIAGILRALRTQGGSTP
ncbi:mannonate dehydratase [Falsiroseomonas oryzae]|uniref:mannonate dehydratase n=1 Tax=Falsiroseomonas oryzae TaxID=2766473 RepID=UPI0022EB329C|nr:mannonate dehydratase [Roseomonas sp. MO-31]